ncbi:helix-turn-helix transcriptional regulator [Agreia pratensis]|nr:helix-turn-helix transcriptional regulator [Microbacterium sp. VKM Ac-2870]MBF4633879.1 helix-turn-helix transcriptional regulator [Agreia pratensis]
MPIGPVTYGCVKIIVVREGSAILFSEFGEKPVGRGDVVVLAPNVLCGSEPAPSITVTTIYIDRRYLVDQFYWQHAGEVRDHLDAADYLEARYSEPAQILHLGEQRAEHLMPWLDELVALSLDQNFEGHFYRMQALLFAVLDVIVPRIKTSSTRRSPSQRERTNARPARFRPLREEAIRTRDLLRSTPSKRWTLDTLAEEVHLSPTHLSRVFVEAFGRTPLSYLNMLRSEEMARLLRETDLPIGRIAPQVGWADPGHAARVFRANVGVTPSRYRAMDMLADEGMARPI